MKAFALALGAGQLSELCARVRAYADEVEAVALSEEAAQAAVADVIWRIPAREDALAGDYAASVAKLVADEKPEAVFIASSVDAKLLAGRLCALLGTSAVCDVTSVSGGYASHMVYGGAAVRSDAPVAGPAVYLVNPFALEAAQAAGACEVREAAFVEPGATVRLIGTAPREKSTVNLAAATRVVGVGRGIGGEEGLAAARELADAIGAELGCTRPVAEEEKLLPREAYIGVSGAMVAPDVYVAVGISGQVQHMVGANQSKTILAINKDKNAPIFKYADCGIVGDLRKILPAVIERL